MRLALIFAAVLTASIAFAQEPGILMVNDVKPGMEGYGETVFSGTTRERFTFRVRSIVPDFRGWPKVIVVQLTGCPGCSEGGVHMFEHHQIYGGMSGSPMYVVDPETRKVSLIGGLAMAKDFATTSKALITPIEYQLGMAAGLTVKPGSSVAAVPGDYSASCLVYGDRDWCFNSTITAHSDGRFFTTSHDLSWGEKEVFPYGEAALPVFRIPVAELLESQESPTKLAGTRLEPVGSAVMHGKFGFVVSEGALPDTVPVTLTVNGVFEQPLVITEHMAYHKHAPAMLSMILQTLILQLPGDPEGSTAEVVIRLTKPAGVIRFVDSFGTANPALESILKNLIVQEKQDLRVERVDMTYLPVQKRDYLYPVKISVKGSGERATLSILARRSYDNETSQLNEVVDATVLPRYRSHKFLGWGRAGRKLFWWDGATLQNYILGRIPVREAFALLDRIREREALYLVYAEDDKNLVADARGPTGSWTKHLPEIRILMRSKPEDGHFFLPPDKDNVSHAIEFENK